MYPPPVTSFYPLVPQSLDALRAALPASLECVRIDYEGTAGERLWLALRGSEGRALAVTRDLAHPAGIELTRYGDNSPNAVLQALADHWGCPILSEYEPERFDPTPLSPS